MVVRGVIGLAALLAPTARRAAWRRQWMAEIEHRRASAHTKGLLLFALGSVPHAFYLRRTEMKMRGYWADLRHSVRALARRPAFTALAVATLAVGIGSVTAIFSLAEATLLRPLPLPESDRLVRVYSTNPSRGFGRFSMSFPDFQDVGERTGLFQTVSLYRSQEQNLSGDGDAERVRGVAVLEAFFQTLGSSMVVGRPFVAEDHRPESLPTAILSQRLWTRRFGADSSLVGRTVRLDGVPHTVVGVARDREAWPLHADLWVPLQWGSTVPDWAGRSNHAFQVVGRLAEGVSVEDASRRAQAVTEAVYSGENVEERDRGTGAVVVPLHSSESGEGVGTLFATLGTAVFLVLLIACMNASGLLLTRAWSRARELSLRAALGAGKARLVLTLMGESFVLAGLGGALGVSLAVVALRRAFTMTPPEVQALGEIHLNGPVISVALAISLLASLLAGLIPALRASRVPLAEALKEGGAGGGYGKGATRLRRGLVVAELAFSLALLVAAGLTVRGFQRQLDADPGFEEEALLSFSVALPNARYGEEALVDEYYRRAIERLEAHPGILAATTTSALPLGAARSSTYRSFILDGAPEPPDGPEFGALWVEVDPSYFRTLGVEPARGRGITEEDRGGAPLVAVVNERFSRLISPDEALVGRRIRSVYDEVLPRTVVGVVSDVQFNGVSRATRMPVVFVPRAQAGQRAMDFLVRCAGDPSLMLPVVRRIMSDVDPDIALDRLQSLEDAHAADLGGVRFMTTLFTAFGALALLLAVGGVYGLVAHTVSRRTQEIGVRMALGATPGTVRRAVLRETAWLAAIGLGLGLVLAYGGARVIASGMNGVATIEVSTFALVSLVLLVSVLLATWAPAVRATRVDPVQALRSE